MSASARKFFHPHPFLWQQKINIKSEPSGSSVELTTKSSKSKTPVPAPSGWNFDQTLKPKIHGTEKSLKETINKLIEFCEDYPTSKEKLEEMKKVLHDQKFVSFIN